MIAAKLATLREGERKAISPRGEVAKTQQEAATMLDVGKRSVERARVVQEHGVPDLVTAVEQGEVKVKNAAEFAKAVPPLDQARLIGEHGSVGAAVQATVKTKADRAVKQVPRKAPDPTLAADRAELIEARKEIERLRKRVDEFENFLPAYEQWLLEADQIVKSRKRVISREPWSNLLFCLHPDQRKTRTDEQLDQAYTLINRLKLVLCDEKEVPTQKPRTPGYDWEARRRAKQSRGSSELTGRKESVS